MDGENAAQLFEFPSPHFKIPRIRQLHVVLKKPPAVGLVLMVDASRNPLKRKECAVKTRIPLGGAEETR